MDRADTDTDPEVFVKTFEDSGVLIIDKPPAPVPTDCLVVTFRVPAPRVRFPRASRPPTNERDPSS